MIDYTIDYFSLGFYPVTDNQAAALVNTWAAKIGGWDEVRKLPLGVYQNVMINGHYYSLSIEGHIEPEGSVYIYVYDMQDPNSVDSIQAMLQIQENLNKSLPAPDFLTKLGEIFSGLTSNILLLGLAGVAVYAYAKRKK